MKKKVVTAAAAQSEGKRFLELIKDVNESLNLILEKQIKWVAFDEEKNDISHSTDRMFSALVLSELKKKM